MDGLIGLFYSVSMIAFINRPSETSSAISGGGRL